MDPTEKRAKRPNAKVGDIIGCFRLLSFERAERPEVKRYKKVWTVRCLNCGGTWNAEIDLLRRNQNRGCPVCRKKKQLDDAVACAMAHVEDEGNPVSLAMTAGRIRAILKAEETTNECRGVFFLDRIQRWWAYITFRSKYYTLGYFTEKADAVAARRYAEEKVYNRFLAWYKENYPDEWNRLGLKSLEVKQVKIGEGERHGGAGIQQTH